MFGSAFVTARLAKLYGKPAYEAFYRNGFHLLRRHFYGPVPDADEIPPGYWDQQSDLIGIDMNEPGALALLDDVFPLYAAEFRSEFPTDRPAGWQQGQFYLFNDLFMAGDAHVYYAMIRHLKPRRVIEIGSGNSTLVAIKAGLANANEGGFAPELTAIEPNPWPLFKASTPGLTRLVERRLQDVDLALFDELGAGDILFIDSTHVLRAGNDVELEYLEILPRLKSGVFVHIHDISLPERYPKTYFDHLVFWNEQQLLQAFLAFNKDFEVVWPANFVMINHEEKVLAAFPEIREMRSRFPGSEPSSFWLRRK